MAGTAVESSLSAYSAILRDWQSSDAKNQIAIVGALSRIPSARGVALEFLPKVAQEVEEHAAPASDRSELMMLCARAALPMDKELARNFFERAIRLTEKIDVEAISQLELSAVVAEAGIDGSRSERVDLAKKLANTASAADATLGMDDHFPWSAIVKGVAALDLPTGLAAISQWRDFGALSHQRSIPALLSGRAISALPGEYKFALSVFAQCENIELRDCFGDEMNIPTGAIDRYCRDSLIKGDRSSILGVRWEASIANENPKTARKVQLRSVAAKLLEWHPGPDRSDITDTDGEPIKTDAEVGEALAQLAASSDLSLIHI